MIWGANKKVKVSFHFLIAGNAWKYLSGPKNKKGILHGIRIFVNTLQAKVQKLSADVKQIHEKMQV